MRLPNPRSIDIIEQDLGAELLIYDLRINKAFTLNETSKIVYQACFRNQTSEDLKITYKLTDDLIHLTLQELKENNLIEDYDGRNYFAGLSRREIIRRVGLATMTALPVIASLSAPPATQAASTVCGTTCSNNAPCSNPCAICRGTGTCSAGGSACTNLGGSCSTSGVCSGVFPGPFFCSVPGGTCPGPGTCTTFGICNGVGACQA